MRSGICSRSTSLRVDRWPYESGPRGRVNRLSVHSSSSPRPQRSKTERSFSNRTLPHTEMKTLHCAPSVPRGRCRRKFSGSSQSRRRSPGRRRCAGERSVGARRRGRSIHAGKCRAPVWASTPEVTPSGRHDVHTATAAHPSNVAFALMLDFALWDDAKASKSSVLMGAILESRLMWSLRRARSNATCGPQAKVEK